MDGGTDKLVEVAKVHPHAAFSGFIQCFMNKLAFLCRTTRNNIDHLLLPLKEKIRLSFIPTLAGRAPPSDSIRDLLALPPRLGGIGTHKPYTAIYNRIPCLGGHLCPTKGPHFDAVP